MDTSITSTVYQNYDALKEPGDILSNISQKYVMLEALGQVQKKLTNLEADRVEAENNLENYKCKEARNRNQRSSQVCFTHANGFNDDKGALNLNKDDLSLQLSKAEVRCEMLEHQICFMKKLLAKNTVKKENSSNLTKLHIFNDTGSQKFDKHQIAKKSYLNTRKEKKASVTLEKKDDHVWCTRARCSACAAAVSQDNSPRKDVKFNDSMTKANGDLISDKFHHRLMLKDLPFVVGQSTSDSHSVTANIQQVFSVMNKHNPILCSKSPPKKPINQPNSNDDLGKVIHDLQDEFSSMAFEYRELKRHSKETTDKSLKYDLEREIDNVIQRMEMKGDQINKLRQLKISRVSLYNTEKIPAQKLLNFHGSNSGKSNLNILKGTKNLLSTLQQSM